MSQIFTVIGVITTGVFLLAVLYVAWQAIQESWKSVSKRSRFGKQVFKNLPFKFKIVTQQDMNRYSQYQDYMLITFPNKYKYKVQIQQGVKTDGVWSYATAMICGIGNHDGGVRFDGDTDLLTVYSHLEIINSTLSQKGLNVTWEMDAQRKWKEIGDQINNLKVLQRKHEEQS
jgi:hypothetical protein